MAVTKPAANQRVITGRWCARSTMYTRCAAFSPAALMSFCSSARTQAAASATREAVCVENSRSIFVVDGKDSGRRMTHDIG